MVMTTAWQRRHVAMRRLLGVRRRRMPRIRPGAAPGTVVAPDPERRIPARITLMHYTAAGVTESTDKTIDECLAMVDRPGVTWINVDGLGEPEIVTRIGERLR